MFQAKSMFTWGRSPNPEVGAMKSDTSCVHLMGMKHPESGHLFIHEGADFFLKKHI